MCVSLPGMRVVGIRVECGEGWVVCVCALIEMGWGMGRFVLVCCVHGILECAREGSACS